MPDLPAPAAVADEPLQEPLRALFSDLADGRLQALEPLYAALSGDIYGLALWRTSSADDAADVLQEVFVRLARAGGTLRRVRQPRSFVLRIAHRVSADVHRRRRRRAEEPLEDTLLVETAPPEAERAFDAGRVSRALRELPPKHRDVVYLHTFAGCSFSEAGRVLGIPTFTAASRYRLALARLRRLMGVEP